MTLIVYQVDLSVLTQEICNNCVKYKLLIIVNVNMQIKP